ncbi:MAG: 2-succinyl-5-enolpyruvyl-6-hydroxy-3-cyclohexene-1-carboxylic-acid synthase [Bdellovibrionales bacterium RIFOXYD12_FULL_39_22]|nr:MAG: 2-succinyl-5-enolpyruvyl-6-hydroxy-3-cyclohexene-1-carboxylic-acid synthase [Bdellovibrionales bacterium RIFOXYB1_FULL_39_21]OFZ43844.1 MAG: 2-succinyl-5-enolpyruvyl-6-hydroxy-3-cyclohexene-1-carboxylic-acid synthase [Bdellovibrionales bacterium RIFOXYC12_FULL_39_17]OFZ48822.1 MAG: 2-succinyl-5-enolpyruvyl-6-hydroxy-3-cyclohexene-1-carboxylic-acid synthase [Bdellovibrionales bacterium RIFOXYC1_FULL_39_130]OFZ68760.1 MAG: 2-succinyl-5-enolpyruvyl-6-hydroxy-3-cyclohexene-1-carboxylic-acid 
MERDNGQDEQFSQSTLATKGIHNLSRLWSLLIIHEMICCNIDHFFISPGLRNTPLIKALTLFPLVKKIIAIDERSLAYQALGYTKASGKMAVLLCTSGTAMANYSPALIEASKYHLPLLVLSADRPFELVAVNDNQTMEQANFFRQWAYDTLNLPDPQMAIAPNKLKKIVSHFLTQNKGQGPLHINVPLRQPLDIENENIDESFINSAVALLNKKTPAIQITKAHNEVGPINLAKIDLLLIGELPPALDKNAILSIIKNFPGPIYIDITSGLKHFHPSLDLSTISSLIFSSKTPLKIVQIGDGFTAKLLYQYLAQLPADSRHIQITNGRQLIDPAFSLTEQIIGELEKILPSLTIHAKNILPPIFRPDLKKVLEELPFSFAHIASVLNELIPNDSNLFLANSSAIRIFDSYTYGQSKNIFLFSNRGVSGIEGNISTSCGIAHHLPTQVTTMVIGDISFLHDMGSLLEVSKAVGKIIIVLANDFGGGIFKQLPIAQDHEVLEVITTSHQYTFEKLAAQFSLNYQCANNVGELRGHYLKALSRSGPEIIEVILDSKQNLHTLNQLTNIFQA